MSGKEAFEIHPLDSLAIKTLLEKVKSAELAVKTHTEILTVAQAVYAHAFTKLAVEVGKTDASDLDKYFLNFKTNRLEPMPVQAEHGLSVVTRSPDADEPSAPFREADKVG